MPVVVVAVVVDDDDDDDVAFCIRAFSLCIRLIISCCCRSISLFIDVDDKFIDDATVSVGAGFRRTVSSKLGGGATETDLGCSSVG